MTVDSRDRFSATADDYDRFRPGYPKAVVDWIARKASLGRGVSVADVGCGTGIAARLFSSEGFEVTGVDPNEEMLARARVHGQATFVRGEADATGLSPSSMQLVYAAQAFHWFDLDRAFAEFRRILVPDGWIAAFWNQRDATPFLAEYEKLLSGIPEYGRVRKPREAIALIEKHPAVTDLRATDLRHKEFLDREALRGRLASSSYVVHGERPMADVLRDVDALFDRFAAAGHVEIAYRVPVRLWRLRPP